MTAPDHRRTAQAMRDVRTVFPDATLLETRSHYMNRRFIILRSRYSSWLDQIGSGDTPKQAWWNAREKALAHALTR